jgi:hypothetical protein
VRLEFVPDFLQYDQANTCLIHFYKRRGTFLSSYVSDKCRSRRQKTAAAVQKTAAGVQTTAVEDSRKQKTAAAGVQKTAARVQKTAAGVQHQVRYRLEQCSLISSLGPVYLSPWLPGHLATRPPGHPGTRV